MKNTIAAAVGGALLATVLFTIPDLVSQEPALTSPVTAVERYEIFSLAPYNNDLERMERELNSLAARGWRVRTGVLGALVLVR